MRLIIDSKRRPLTRDSSDTPYDRLILVIALKLYDPRPTFDLYKEHRSDFAKYFRDAAAGIIQPVVTDLQRKINLLIPTGKTARLYFSSGTTGNAAPDRALTLKRITNPRWDPTLGVEYDEPQYLWAFDTHYVTRNFKAPNRDGILIYWGDVTPYADQAATLEPNVIRITRGGRATQHLVTEIQRSYELRRQLTFMTTLSIMLDAIHNDELTVWHHQAPGKAVLKFDETPDPYFMPSKFEGIRIRPTATLGTKRRAHVICDAPPISKLPDQSRYFGLIIKDRSEHVFDDMVEQMLVEELILTQLTPIVGIERENETVDIFGPCFSEGNVCIALYQTRSSRGAKNIPSLTRETRRAFTPNSTLACLLKRYLTELEPIESTGWKVRFLRTCSILTTFISPPRKNKPQMTIPEIMEDIHCAFSPTDLDRFDTKEELAE